MYRALRRDAPALFLADRNTAVVSRYEDCDLVLRSPEAFSSHAQAGMDPVLIGADPPAHTGMRRDLARFFSPTQVAGFEPFLRETARALLSRLRAAPAPVDLVAGYAVPLPLLLMRALLQIDSADGERFERWTDALQMGANATYRTLSSEAIQTAVAELSRFLMQEHFPRCAAPPARGLVSDLLRAIEAGQEPGSHARLRSLVRFLIFAGVETTRHWIGTAVLTFHREAGAWDALREAPGRIPRFLDEVLRFDAPVQLLQRTAADPLELHGVPIPRGAAVAVLLGSANRDEAQFEEADRFWPDRVETAHLGFGAGPHFCLGSHLARLEARVALEELVAGWPDLRIVEPLEAVRPTDTFTTRGPRRLLVA